MKPFLSLEHVGVIFPADDGELEAVADVTFSVRPQEFVALVGPSGCGKSTLVRVVAGLLRPTRGRVLFPALEGGKPRVGLVFQKANLMPWRTVEANIALPLELQGLPKAEIRRRVAEMVALMGLQGFEKALPRDLSGGMAQRVALARSFVFNPSLLLLDEPFVALDALTREYLWDELLRMWRRERQTVLMVTHSVSEALLLADRVIVLTARPARVKLELTVDIPRPRHPDLRYTPRFGELVRRLRAALEIPHLAKAAET